MIVELCVHGEGQPHNFVGRIQQHPHSTVGFYEQCPGGRVLEGVWIPAKEGAAEERREVGFCIEHHSLAERYDDGSWSCWWEDVVEASGGHSPSDFKPLLDVLASAQEIDS